jgi:hypothetical protein
MLRLVSVVGYAVAVVCLLLFNLLGDEKGASFSLKVPTSELLPLLVECLGVVLFLSAVAADLVVLAAGAADRARKQIPSAEQVALERRVDGLGPLAGGP